MAEKLTQQVTLNIKFDPEVGTPPSLWVWPELLDCDPEDIRIVNVVDNPPMTQTAIVLPWET